MKNMNQMMKQVQKMQQEMARAQAELKETIIETSAGGGVVKVTMNGHKEGVSININPGVVECNDVEMLEDLVITAVNDALAQVDELSAKELGKYTGGLNMPGLF